MLGFVGMFGKKALHPLGYQGFELIFLYVRHKNNFERIFFITLFDNAVELPTFFKTLVGFLEIILVGHISDLERYFHR